jgi:S-adenosylmethionine-diacylglycerol 3-amino-3-carboxypropyl transferase
MPTSRASDLQSPPVPYGGRLMFTQSWEDPACDLAALRPRPGETILAITSGCDNVLGFLLTDPGQIIAVDLNPAQGYLLELKQAAFRSLAHADMLALLGVRASGERPRLLQCLRADLSPLALQFWEARQELLERGLLTGGGFERYYAMLRALLQIVIGRRRLEQLFTLPAEGQRDFYLEHWDTWRWRTLVRIACSKYVLGKRLDPSWFAHAEVASFGKHFTRLAEHVVAELPARSNYLLAQLCLGRYLDEDTVPDYLRRENFPTIRQRLDRITMVTADIGAALAALPPQSVDCFALSNVFEYSARELFDRTRAALVRVARPGARFALRNLLAPRRLADDPAFVVDTALSDRLREADRGFIYSRFEAATLAKAAP